MQRAPDRLKADLPGGVAPADWGPGADVLPVQQESDRYWASHQRQDPGIAFGK